MAKTSSDSLFRLIKSMSGHEKRYFKLFSSLHTIGDQKNYLQLFDFLDKARSYDEEKIKAHFKGQAFMKRFDNVKGRLFQAIMKSLDVYHAQDTLESAMGKQMHYVEILFAKGLYNECLKILNKQEEIAWGHLMHSRLIEIYEWRLKIRIRKNPFEDGEDVADFFNQLQEVIDEMVELRNYQEQAFIFYADLYKKIGLARNKQELKVYKDFMSQDLMKNGDDIRVGSKFYYHYILGIYHDAAGEYDKSCLHKGRQVSWMEEHQDIQNENILTYIDILYNYVYSAISAEDYKAAAESIEKMRKLPEGFPKNKGEVVQAHIDSSVMALSLRLYFKEGDFDAGYDMIKDIDELLEEYKGKMTEDHVMSICFNAARVSYAKGDRSTTLKFINKIINETNPNSKQDIQSFTRILNILLHYDMGNDDLLSYIIKSTYRFLLKRKNLYQLEDTILRFIKNNTLLQKKDMLKAFKDLRTELVKLKEDPFEKRAFEYFDLVAWLDSKIEEKPYAEVLKS